MTILLSWHNRRQDIRPEGIPLAEPIRAVHLPTRRRCRRSLNNATAHRRRRRYWLPALADYLRGPTYLRPSVPGRGRTQQNRSCTQRSAGGHWPGQRRVFRCFRWARHPRLNARHAFPHRRRSRGYYAFGRRDHRLRRPARRAPSAAHCLGPSTAEEGGCKHFMLKEIYDQPPRATQRWVECRWIPAEFFLITWRSAIPSFLT